MTDVTPGTGLDLVFDLTRRRAARGDRAATRTLLVLLVHGLREEHGIVLTPAMRLHLANALQTIYNGTDPAEAFYLNAGSGTPKWEMLTRNSEIIRSMNLLVDQGIKPWPAAGQLARSGNYCDEQGQPISQKTINNIWLKYKDDPDFKVTFTNPSFPE